MSSASTYGAAAQWVTWVLLPAWDTFLILFNLSPIHTIQKKISLKNSSLNINKFCGKASDPFNRSCSVTRNSRSILFSAASVIPWGITSWCTIAASLPKFRLPCSSQVPSRQPKNVQSIKRLVMVALFHALPCTITNWCQILQKLTVLPF